MNVNTMVLAGKVVRQPEDKGDGVSLVVNAAEFKRDNFHPRGGTFEPNYVQVRVMGAAVDKALALQPDSYVVLEGSVGMLRWEARGETGQLQKRSTTIMRAYRVKPLGDTPLTINNVVLYGRLGAVPDIKFFNTGGAITNFSMATSEFGKDGDGGTVEDTVWTQVRVMGKRAESAADNLAKGSAVIVTGSIITDTWKDKQGQKQYRTFLRTFGYNLVGGRKAPVAPGYAEEPIEETLFPIEEGVPF